MDHTCNKINKYTPTFRLGVYTYISYLLWDGVAALLRDVNEVEHAAVQVRQRRDGLLGWLGCGVGLRGEL
jgi:hypothetical protein